MNREDISRRPSTPPSGEARVNSTTTRGSMIVLNEYYETVAGYAYDAVQLLEEPENKRQR